MELEATPYSILINLWPSLLTHQKHTNQITNKADELFAFTHYYLVFVHKFLCVGTEDTVRKSYLQLQYV